MLIRIYGGSSGIKDYLEKGHKSGREYTRDELDKRITLDGDLSAADALVGTMAGEGQKYIHLTMSFAESDISENKIRQVYEDFKKDALTAYDPSEYCIYSEIHFPKIKKDIDQSTGEEVDRLPHLHCVIVKKNLLTGKALSPFGYEKQNVKYIDALQEYLNYKHDLISPKDRRRVDFMGEADIKSRVKSDVFKQNDKELRGAILDDMISQGVTTMEAFEALLKEYGSVKSGYSSVTDKHYLKVKPEESRKYVRLEEWVFEKEFIELPTSQKEALLANSDVARTWQKPSLEEVQAVRHEWLERKADELKLLNSGSRKAFATYHTSSLDKQLEILANLKQAFIAKYGKELADEPKQHRERNTKSVGLQPAPGQRGSLRSLSELDVVRNERGNQVLLPRDVSRELVHEGSEQHHSVRRLDDRVREEAASSDNVVNHLLRDAYDRKAQAAATTGEWATIKGNLDAARLLAHVSKSHAVDPKQYEVTKGKDGTDRIRCGKKNYTVSDFLTKELHLSWAEAQPILRDAYAAQLEDVAIAPRQTVAKGLWGEFQAWKGTHWHAEKAAAWSAQKEAAQVLRAEIKGEFEKGRKAVYAAIQSHRGAERRAAVSVLRMQRVEKEKAATLQSKAQRDELKARFNQRPAALYRQWLAVQADKGNAEALRELRRQQQHMPAAKAAAGSDAFAPIHSKAPVHAGDLLQAERITYTVSDRGDVTYKRNGQEFMRDEARMVVMLDSSKADNIETALRLAAQKFGSSLSINGGEDFQRRAVEVAVERGLRIDFKNEELQTYKHHLEEQASKKFIVPTSPIQSKEKAAVPTTDKAPVSQQPAEPARPATKPANDLLSSLAAKRQGWMQDQTAQVEQQRQEEEQRRRAREAQRRNKPQAPDYEPGM